MKFFGFLKKIFTVNLPYKLLALVVALAAVILMNALSFSEDYEKLHQDPAAVSAEAGISQMGCPVE